MVAHPTIRQARHSDATAMLAIYQPFIEHTVVSLETVVPSEAEFAQRIAARQLEHEWLVAELDGVVIGYAYGSKHRARGAYRTSCEVSAYVADPAQGRGVARLLYARLFERLVELGYCNALAGIAMPNDTSVAFHVAMGFTLVGVYHHVGFKHGAWHDVAWYERVLREGPPNDA
ncbi:MAG: L-amino acid N-acyltransferase YncA [Neolewinella sp.]|jgi:L-amino acid N-acyltransferase YncA